jgi:hypothetical protein
LNLEETFETFLKELDSSIDKYSGKELLEAEVLRVMRKEGFLDKQIYQMALEDLLELFYDAYHWDADVVLSGYKSSCFQKSAKTSRIV